MDGTIAMFLLQDGVATGAIYVLLAVALVMVFTVTRVIFVPQGEFVAFAALTQAGFDQGHLPGTVWLVTGAGTVAFAFELAAALRRRSAAGLLRGALLFLALPGFVALVAAFGIDAGSAPPAKIAASVALVVPLGPILYRLAFQPMAGAGSLSLLIAAIALHLVLVGLGLFLFGPEGVRTAGPSGTLLEWGELSVSLLDAGIVAASLVVILLLFGFFGWSLLGKSLRATAVNRRGAQLVGVSPDDAGQLTFALAAAIGALAGVLIAPVTTVYYDSGFLLGLKGFVGAIIGGLAAYPAAALGALLIGIVEAFSSFYASAFKEVILFTLILPVLLWRSMAQGGTPAADPDHD